MPKKIPTKTTPLRLSSYVALRVHPHLQAQRYQLICIKGFRTRDGRYIRKGSVGATTCTTEITMRRHAWADKSTTLRGKIILDNAVLHGAELWGTSIITDSSITNGCVDGAQVHASVLQRCHLEPGSLVYATSMSEMRLHAGMQIYNADVIAPRYRRQKIVVATRIRTWHAWWKSPSVVRIGCREYTIRQWLGIDPCDLQWSLYASDPEQLRDEVQSWIRTHCREPETYFAATWRA